MTPLSIGVLAVSMSVDAFLASVGKGARAKRPNVAMPSAPARSSA